MYPALEHAVRERHHAGHSQRAIARDLKIDRRKVKRIVEQSVGTKVAVAGLCAVRRASPSVSCRLRWHGVQCEPAVAAVNSSGLVLAVAEPFGEAFAQRPDGRGQARVGARRVSTARAAVLRTAARADT